ncbi:enoyl-CoA hydratase/isomerase [Phenylobacterium sp.]|uniref:enoyl-CoA hydratase/isomerase n=1 Tax=Phenylobacterium sp. TaxID=1871053 RepID=UPI002F4076A9
MELKKVKTLLEDGVAVITLADPGTLNAAGVDMVAELSAAMERFAAPDSGARCVVLTGEGRGFCSGANLAGRADDPTLEDPGLVLEAVYNPFVSLMRGFPIPTVAAVNGPAAGIGCSIALCCDLIVAAESAYFLQAFRRIGLVPDGGATYLLPRFVGKARAMELALLGERLPARAALEWGLINRCTPDAELMATAHGLARALADGPKGLAHIRKLVWDGLDAAWAEQLHAERTAQRQAGLTEDFREGVTAFIEKRPAKFKGR